MAVSSDASWSFSFAVGSVYGPRSSKWIVSANDRGDVFVTNAMIRKDLKVTLHKSGRWHLKWVGDAATKGEAPLAKSHRDEMAPDLDQAGLRLIIPDSCLRKASDVDDASEVDHWLERPPYDGFVTILISNWEATGAAQTHLAGIPFDRFGYRVMGRVAPGDGRRVVLIAHQYTPADDPRAARLNEGLPRWLANFNPQNLDSPERRGIITSVAEIGSLSITEFAID
jgi:hypothetical protein